MISCIITLWCLAAWMDRGIQPTWPPRKWWGILMNAWNRAGVLPTAAWLSWPFLEPLFSRRLQTSLLLSVRLQLLPCSFRLQVQNQHISYCSASWVSLSIKTLKECYIFRHEIELRFKLRKHFHRHDCLWNILGGAVLDIVLKGISLPFSLGKWVTTLIHFQNIVKPLSRRSEAWFQLIWQRQRWFPWERIYL